MDGLLRDCRFALRVLWRRKFVFWSSVFVLASGMAVNIAFFSIVNAVLLRKFPVPAPHELIYLKQLAKSGQASWAYGYTDYEVQRNRVAGRALLTAHWKVRYPVNVQGGDLVFGEAVDWNYFSTLGLTAQRGRLLSEHDQTDPNVVVISSALWHRYWHAEADVVGKTISLGGKIRTIIGVAPDDFAGITDPWSPSRFWIPLTGWRTNIRDVAVSIFGRLHHGTSPTELAAELGSLQTLSSEAGWPRYVVDNATPLGPLPFESSGPLLPNRLAVGLLILGVLVLVVAGSNVGGLLLSAGLERRSELAIRATLGATPLTLAKQLFAEGLMLSCLALALGFGGAVLLVRVFVAVMPMQFVFSVPLDFNVLRFAMAQAIIVGLTCSVWPVSRLSRTRTGASLRDAMPGGSPSWLWLGGLAAGIQVAVSVALVSLCFSSGLALSQAENRNVGYTITDIQVANAFLRWPDERPGPDALKRYGQAQRRFAIQFLEAAQADRAVAQAAVADGLPLQSPVGPSAFDSQAMVAEGAPRGFVTSISPDYFALFEIEVLQGRRFDANDRYGAQSVAIVTESLAERLWTKKTAVGQVISVQSPGTGLRRLEVVGVCANVSTLIGSTTAMGLYVPVDQTEAFGGQFFLTKSRFPGGGIDLRSIITKAEPRAEVFGSRDLRDIANDLLYPRRLAVGLFLVTALIVACVAGIGVFSVVAFGLRVRSQELAIRRALGASGLQILSVILFGVSRIYVGGTLLGVVLISAIVVGSSKANIPITPATVSTVFASTIVLGGVILLAIARPLRGALKSDLARSMQFENRSP